VAETSPLKLCFCTRAPGWLDLSYLFKWCGLSRRRAEAKKAIPSPAKAMDNIMQQCSHSASEYKYKGIIYFPSLTSSAKEEHISASPLFHSPGDLWLVLRSGTFPPARCMRPLEPMDLLVPQHTAGLEIGVLLAIECGGDQPCFILPTSATTAGDP
jgi:hypothetical protein